MGTTTYLRCQECRELLPADAFPIKVTSRSGRRGICSTCRPPDTGRPACRWPDKVAHPDKASALQAISDMYRHGRGNPDLTAYRCRDHWHVGHDLIHFRKRIKAALNGGRRDGTIYDRNRKASQ